MAHSLESLKFDVQSLQEELSQAKEQLAHYQLMASIFDSSTQAIALVDRDFKILSINAAFEKLTHCQEQDLVGASFSELIAPHKHDEDWLPLAESLKDRDGWYGQLWGQRKNGKIFRAETAIQSVDSDTNLHQVKYIFFLHDVTNQKETEEELERQSNYDLITDLPNWKLFLNRFLNALYSSGQKGTQSALLFIGLDGFKTINDTLGYTIGDKLLQEAAVRFARTLPAHGTMARFSGDQFTAVLPDISDHNEVHAIAENLLTSLDRPFDIETEEIAVSCSIGICLWPGDGDDVETLLRNADSAMHKAKESGRNTFHFFTPDIDAKAQAKRSLERDLRHALKDFSEFHLVYQPIVDIKTGRMKSAEALIRWHSASRGLVSPDQFIPLAEQSQMILSLGEWILETACREVQSWSQTTKEPFRVAINVSSRQFRDNDLPATVRRVLDKTAFDPNQLTLEITETLMMENVDAALDMLHDLKSMGVRIAIDDFGTGYSSLSYLKRFPLDTLKIDRMFIRDVTENPDDAAMVTAILTMAQSLGLETIGEGIESKEHLNFLLEKQCDNAQGYFLSRPLRINEFTQFADQLSQKLE